MENLHIVEMSAEAKYHQSIFLALLDFRQSIIFCTDPIHNEVIQLLCQAFHSDMLHLAIKI